MAKKIRWHKKENIDDSLMGPQSDSIKWKSFNEHYPALLGD